MSQQIAIMLSLVAFFVVLGVVVFVQAAVVVRGLTPVPKFGRECVRCGFDIEGLPRDGDPPVVRCPECGAVYPALRRSSPLDEPPPPV